MEIGANGFTNVPLDIPDVGSDSKKDDDASGDRPGVGHLSFSALNAANAAAAAKSKSSKSKSSNSPRSPKTKKQD